MSLILDALNKADGERNPDEAPSLNSNHDVSIEESTPLLNTKIIYGLIGFLIFLVLVVIILMLSGKSDNHGNGTQYNEDKNTRIDASKSLKANSSPTAPLPPNTTNQQSSVAPTAVEADIPQNRYDEMKDKLIAKQYESATQSEKRKSPALKTTEKTSTDIRSTQSSKAIASIYQKSKEEKAKQKIKATPKPTPIAKSPSLEDYPFISFIADLAYAKQKGIPTLMYTEHNFSKNSSSVVLNNVTRHTGQAIADHLTLEAIVEDGIVLQYKTMRFKVVAYNSWINM